MAIDPLRSIRVGAVLWYATLLVDNELQELQLSNAVDYANVQAALTTLRTIAAKYAPAPIIQSEI